MYIQKWRLFLVIILSLLGITYVTPNFLSEQTLNQGWPAWLPDERINLGLDLRGGASLLLEVDVETVVKDQLQSLATEVRQTLRKQNVGYAKLQLLQNGIKLELRDTAQKDKAYKAIRKVADALLVTTSDSGSVEVTFDSDELHRRQIAAVEQSIEIIRRRIDEMGTKEPLIQRQGIARILVQLPGLGDPSEAKKLIGKTAKMTFHLEHPDNRGNYNAHHLPLGAMLVNEEISRGSEVHKHAILLKKDPAITGAMLTDAQAAMDTEHTGGWVVNFVLDALGSKRFGDVTAKNVGQRFAVILDEKVITAPVINSPIPGGRGVITGRFTAKEAQDLAVLLRAGALPAPLAVVEERTVGPDLGADSVKAGENATIMAVILVLAFMFFVYGLTYGGIANIALVLNLILLLAALSYLRATLTLPGIAGIALTLGMAVDANVLIFERIREELKAGRRVNIAIKLGYERAMATILDSNITTLIGAGLLYQFGTGLIRGFSVTLSLGILISMFTAVTVTRVIISIWYNIFGAKSLSFGLGEMK